MRNSIVAKEMQAETKVNLDFTVEKPDELSKRLPLTTQQQPRHSETGLGVLDFDAVLTAVNENNAKTKRERYYKYTDEERFNIGEHTAEFGAKSALRKSKGQFPNLNESTARSMREKYEKEIKLANLQGRDPERKLQSERQSTWTNRYISAELFTSKYLDEFTWYFSHRGRFLGQFFPVGGGPHRVCDIGMFSK